MIDTILQGDALTVLKTLPSESVNCCVTSPPYWGLRDYGTQGIIWDGDENCKHEFTKEIKKGITGGQCVLEGAGKAMTEARYTPDSKHGFCIKCGAWRGELGLEPTPELYVKHIVAIFREVRRVLKNDGTLWLNLGDSYAGSGQGKNGDGTIGKLSDKQRSNKGTVVNEFRHGIGIIKGLKPKDLVGIPWMVAFALRADGWYLRQDIIWSKPNPMPGVSQTVVQRHMSISSY
jgi:DNA modification methylase